MVKKEYQAEENEELEIFKKVCPHCDKPFQSLHKKQLLFNYTSHIGACKFKSKNKDTMESEKPSRQSRAEQSSTTFLMKKEENK